MTDKTVDATATPGHAADPGPSHAGSSVRWSIVAVVGRQLAQMVCALVLARILGPESYGVISMATVYVTLTTLLLDQGLAVALVQRRELSDRLPGTIATANIVSAAVLAVVTVCVAPLVATFFHAPALTGLLQVLGLGLLLKGAAVAPRAMLQRRLAFKPIAFADLGGGVVGAIAGITTALIGFNQWAMAWQVIATDLVMTTMLLLAARMGRLHFSWTELRSVLPFSLRIFGGGGLAYCSRNADNILVGRFLGVEALSLYSMAYRILVIPVQMVGQTVNRVSFPMLARLIAHPRRFADQVLRTFELLAFAAVPSMCLVAVSAPELIELVLGRAWLGAAPLLTVLAVAGARETIFSLPHSVMRAKGAGHWLLRYEFLATAAQLTGIVVGLRFGAVGVAVGYAAAGFAVSPALLRIQSRLAEVSVRAQLGRLLAPLHATAWGVAAYLAVGALVEPLVLHLIVGAGLYLLVGGVVLRFCHPRALRRTIGAVAAIVNLRRPIRGTPEYVAPKS